MTHNTYINTMPYELTGIARAQYHIIGATGNCNRGNLCESIVKYHRGLEYIKNPNISGMVGYDIPEEQIEVKSGASGLGRDIGDSSFSVSEQIRYYFKNAPQGKKWMWVFFDEKTQRVDEFIMNKKEFGLFVSKWLRKKQHLQSNKKSINVRFKQSSTIMKLWFYLQIEKEIEKSA